MTNFDILDNQFLSLSENELSDIDGGLAPLVIFGVAVSWKAIAGGTTLIGSGLAAGYFLGGD
ncbi:excreted peptide [Streptococcus pneumoniae]|uniref:fratricide two-peptide bacteriocin subunit CibA n=1 Tax=Streptococcus pneumoniae TaxID=1313 RepID=UPI00061C8032|nr:fratricide two-peptide bacteriocin subunit CibA [Streptococcus pneumoniae]CGG76502.1 excreted peptide [Streptococcus pneumoniae]VQU36095.1 excreted peptide [Streptococcus pneumoniae]